MYMCEIIQFGVVDKSIKLKNKVASANIEVRIFDGSQRRNKNALANPQQLIHIY